MVLGTCSQLYLPLVHVNTLVVFLCMCTPRQNMLTLLDGTEYTHINWEQVPVMCLGPFLLYVDRHVSGLCVKLTTADRVHNSCTAASTDCKGVSFHSPFSVLPLQPELPLFLNEEILEGPGCPPHPF